jgi:hypothetical protein
MPHKKDSPTLSLEECMISVLRASVDKIEQKQGSLVIKDPKVQEITAIVEAFIRRKKLVCYGGTAINNILPKKDQFYNKKIQLPDYDFFSTNAMDDAIELADEFHQKGFLEVVASAGVHHGTYKVKVSFMAVADITSLDERIFKALHKAGTVIDGITYCPPDYLRMSMYLELSRPDGDVSRWEKVVKRLARLNKHYPIRGKHCNARHTQRLFSSESRGDANKLFYVLRKVFAAKKAVFFGALASSMYAQLGRSNGKQATVPDFDVLAVDSQEVARAAAQELTDAGFNQVTVHSHDMIGEVISEHYEIRVGSDTVAFVYKPLACHGYNTVRVGPLTLRIASIDTMLSLYLAFIYADRPYYDPNRILCMCEELFKTQQRAEFSQKGILRRFDVSCYGKQLTLEDIHRLKTEMYHKLKRSDDKRQFDEWFLRYEPSKTPSKEEPSTKTRKRKVKHRSTPRTRKVAKGEPAGKQKEAVKKKSFLGIF